MATLTSAQAATSVPARHSGGASVLHAAYGTYELTADPSPNDIIELCRVPANARIVGGWMYVDEMDTGTETLDIDLGWAANGGSGTYDAVDADGFGNFGIISGDAFANPSVSRAAGSVIPFSGHFANGDMPKFTRTTMIQATVIDDAATFVAGALSVVVLYVIEATAS